MILEKRIKGFIKTFLKESCEFISDIEAESRGFLFLIVIVIFH